MYWRSAASAAPMTARQRGHETLMQKIYSGNIKAIMRFVIIASVYPASGLKRLRSATKAHAAGLQETFVPAHEISSTCWNLCFITWNFVHLMVIKGPQGTCWWQWATLSFTVHSANVYYKDHDVPFSSDRLLPHRRRDCGRVRNKLWWLNWNLPRFREGHLRYYLR